MGDILQSDTQGGHTGGQQDRIHPLRSAEIDRYSDTEIQMKRAKNG